MQKILMISIGYMLFLFNAGCVGGIYSEKGEQANRTFMLTSEGPVKVSVQTVGRVRLMGSIPGKVVWKYRSTAWAGSRERAVKMANSLIGFDLRTEPKDNSFTGKATFPVMGVGERGYMDVDVMLPLEREVAASVGISQGPLEVLKMKGSLSVRYGTPGRLDVHLFDGILDVSMPGGTADISGRIMKGSVKMGNGEVNIRQEGISQDGDVTVSVDEGTVHITVREDYAGPIRIDAPAMKNRSRIKFEGSGGSWKTSGRKGPGISVSVKRGTVVVEPTLIKGFGRKSR